MRFRFPWQRKDEEEYFPMEKPRRPRETLKQAAKKVLIKELKRTSDRELAEKIIQRRMKADPDGYLAKQFLT